MKIRELTIQEISQIYQDYITIDFPLFERRPLETIIELYQQQRYFAYGLFDQKIIGYAFFLGNTEELLCDYFAIIKEYRHQKIGSYFLQKCLNTFSKATLYFEVEKPAANDKTKEKRIQFYLKNNLLLSSIEVNLFHVDYCILANKEIHISQIQSFYHSIYDDDFYDRYVIF